ALAGLPHLGGDELGGDVRSPEQRRLSVGPLDHLIPRFRVAHRERALRRGLPELPQATELAEHEHRVLALSIHAIPLEERAQAIGRGLIAARLEPAREDLRIRALRVKGALPERDE